MTPAPLYLANDRTIRKKVETWNPTLDVWEPAEGLPATARISLTPTGAAVDASLEIALAERAPGDFYGTLQGSDLTAHLAALAGTIVYLVVSVGGAEDYLDFKPLRVTKGRPA